MLSAAAVLVLAVLGAAPASGVDTLLPVRTTFKVAPTPAQVPPHGRTPVSLRLTDSISTADGSHPPTANQVRIDLDKRFHLDLSGVPRCPGGVHFDIRTKESRCEKFKFATGTIKVEVAFPGQEPVLVAGSAIAFETDRGRILISAYLPAPVTGEVLFPTTFRRGSAGRYGVRITAAVPKLAGGSGSLVYLGLRFRKGLFSMACPEGRFQSRLTNSFADGSIGAVGVITKC